MAELLEFEQEDLARQAGGEESGVQMMHRLHSLAADQGPTKMPMRFFTEPQLNEEKTKKAGRPIFDDVEMIEIRFPGTSDTYRAPVTHQHRETYPKQYIAWKNQQDQDAASGMPLAAWPQLTKAEVEEAKFLGVKTVEQLAEVPDSSLQKFGPGWIQKRQKARDWLNNAKDGALLSRLRSELEERDAKIATLEDMLNKQAAALKQAGIVGGPVQAAPQVDIAALVAEQVKAALAAQPAPAPKKRGRPPKTEAHPAE